MKTRLHLFLIPIFLVSLQLYSQDCPDSCEYYIPNALTPDSDPSSDVFELISNCPFFEVEFIIYNRWGEIIFQSSDPKMKFDITGQVDGAYTWKLSGEFCNSQVIDDTGRISIIN